MGQFLASGELLREAAWVARCVGRADAAPLTDAGAVTNGVAGYHLLVAEKRSSS